MTIPTRAGVLILGLTVGLPGCDGSNPQPPTAPSSNQQPSGPSGPAGFPPGVLTDSTISGVVFELTATGRTPLEGVAVYCELCGEETHSWALTDANGLYTFNSGVWNAGTFPTSLGVDKAGYVDPPGLPAVTPPNPAGPGWREVMVIGHTRFDMELVKR